MADSTMRSEEAVDRAALQHPREEGLSLDELTQAFAQMLQAGDDPYTPAEDAAPGIEPAIEASQDPSGESSTTDASDDACCPITPRSILEAMLFVGRPDNAPLTSTEVAALMRGVRAEEVDEMVVDLNANYASAGCPYRIVSVGAGYRLALTAEHDDLREKFSGKLREARLSQAAIDVLSLVAYHQPATSDEISRLRGKPSGSILSQLVRRQLIRVERSEESPKKTHYVTTQRFLELFGLSSLDELPQHDESSVE